MNHRYKKRLLNIEHYIFVYFKGGDKPWTINIGGMDGEGNLSHGIPTAFEFPLREQAVNYLPKVADYLKRAFGIPFDIKKDE